MTPGDKMEAVRAMYEKGDLTAADARAVLDAGATERAQKFFRDLFVAARSPGYGDHHRQFVANLLLRATEAGIYVPEAP